MNSSPQLKGIYPGRLESGPLSACITSFHAFRDGTPSKGTSANLPTPRRLNPTLLRGVAAVRPIPSLDDAAPDVLCERIKPLKR
jgi:hypothetical protein